MLVGAEYFQEERLLPLTDAGKAMNPKRSRVTLWNWHAQGLLNQSSDHVFLRICPLPSGYHTSLEEVARFLRAATSNTVKAQVVGGSLHGHTVEISGGDEVVTAGDLADQLGGRVVPAKECYEPRRFVDKRGQVRTFLIYQELTNGQEMVIGMLEGE